MNTLKVNYKAVNVNVTLSREFDDSSDLRRILGEVLYGVELQCHDFNTNDIYCKVLTLYAETKKKTIKVNTISGEITVSLTKKK